MRTYCAEKILHLDLPGHIPRPHPQPGWPGREEGFRHSAKNRGVCTHCRPSADLALAQPAELAADTRSFVQLPVETIREILRAAVLLLLPGQTFPAPLFANRFIAADQMGTLWAPSGQSQRAAPVHMGRRSSWLRTHLQAHCKRDNPGRTWSCR